jgi:4-amino-4-deoxy-L-arabinose transferase-like glycosyltransferase
MKTLLTPTPSESPAPLARHAAPWVGAILLLLAFHGLDNWRWASRNFQSTNWDDQLCYWRGMLELRWGLRALVHNPALGPPQKLARAYWLTGQFDWPHWSRLSQWAGLLSTRLLGSGYSGLTAANLLWTAVLLFSVYWLGQRLAGPAAGFAAAFLVSFYPGVVGLSRNFAPHYAAAAMSAACFAFLLRAASFRSFSRSLQLGVVLGIGLLVNPKILFYFLAPFVMCFYKACRRRRDRRVPQLAANAAAILATGALVSVSWWFPYAARLIPFFAGVSVNGHYDYPTASFWSSWITWRHAYYATALYFELSPLLAVAAVAALAFSFAKADGFLREFRGEWIAWLAGPLAQLRQLGKK